jgi:hypothetical protein
MDIKTILTIIEAGRTVATYAPIAIDTAMKIKNALEKGSDLTVSVQRIAEETIDNNEQTLKLIAQWRRDNPKT